MAECRNGAGSEFAQSLQGAQTPEQVIDRFRADGWSASSGKAMMFARAAQQYKVIVVSNAFDRDYLTSLFLQKAASLGEAVADACQILGENPKAVVVPYASGLAPVETPAST